MPWDLEFFSATAMKQNGLFLALAGFALFMLATGAVGVFSSRDRSAIRLRKLAISMNESSPSLSKGPEANAPRGWKKALIPDDPSKRAQIRFQLAKVGFDRRDSVELFFVIRLALALAPLIIVLSLTFLSQTGLLPNAISDTLESTSRLLLMQIAAIGAAIGFYAPGYWLNKRIKERKQKLTQAFPNAMDLIQISVEAGMGFDAALARVGLELGRVSPELAYELLLLQMETQAGRDREAALFDMAERMGIEQAKSFALVVVQSMQFGTSLTAALKMYSAEMRQMRELAAQEKANKLPVQMSAVMSILMLPALFLITLTPIVIRYLEVG
ncbi:type II secretion system F family protein [Antarctobacter sp.]|uniref:type II secretion system F family protein n=1 Tax=Antarctobacter sp. TaxID=1872577 RepID=UPI003A957416